MRIHGWFTPPRHLLAWFLVVTVVPTIALFALGWSLLSDNADLTQQIRQRLQAEAGIVAADLRQQLDALARADATTRAADQALFLSLSDRGVLRHSGAPLLFAPAEATDLPANAEQSTPNAAALLRTAQNHRAAGRTAEALQAYGALAGDTHGFIFGLPAALQGALARVRLLTDLERWEDAALEARMFRPNLIEGRWTIDRTSFQAAWRDLDLAERRQVPYPPTFSVALAVEQLFHEWIKARTGAGSIGRRGQWVETQHITLIWSSTATELTLQAIPTDVIARVWSEPWQMRRVAVTLLDTENRVIAGDAEPAADTVAVTPAESGLPWSIRVASSAPNDDLAAALWRRRQLQIVLGLAVILGLAGAYFVTRAVRREFAVAQLQKDFVSAVSHEFRTPLTSMSHLLELLKGDRPLDDARRRRYYDALDRETGRLRRFVDSLLDFGRVESGAARYDLERVAPSPLVSSIVDEFRQDAVCEGREIRLDAPSALPDVAVDQQAFRLVMRNLLENAVKYAPGPAPVDVEISVDGRKSRALAVRVRDAGPGIPRDEQQAVFEKFVRGAAARASGVRGTGVGLALSRQIIRAHGGDIELTSERDHGSTFTIILPALAESPTADVVEHEHHAAPANR